MPPKDYIAKPGATTEGAMGPRQAAEKLAQLWFADRKDENNQTEREAPPAEVEPEPEVTDEVPGGELTAEEKAELQLDAKPVAEEPVPSEEEPEEPAATEPQPGSDDEVVFELDEGEKVTRAEAKKGHLRQKDYTRKTQAVAEERKALKAEAEALRTARDNYAMGVEELQKALDGLQLKEPDWEQLQRENPSQYPIIWAQWNQLQQQRKSMADEAAQLKAASEADEAAKLREYIEEEAKATVEAIPEWSDVSKQKTERQALLAYARSRGFTDQELNLFAMSKLMLLLRTAMKAEQKPQPKPTSKPAPVKGVKPVTPGANRQAPPKGDALKDSREAVKRSGNIHDAARHVQNLLNLGR